MAINIYYSVPAAAGTAFTYSVERQADKAFFDFELRVFRPVANIPMHAFTKPLNYHNGIVADDFNYDEDGEVYIVRLHNVGQDGKVTIGKPVTSQRGQDQGPTKEGGKHMEPTYRAGKKFIGSQVIEAKYRFTFHGNDGFTVHTATLWDDGTSSCNCPRWTKKLQGQDRGCPHSQRALSLTANVDETGEQPDKPATAGTPPTSAGQRTTNPFQRRSRSVDT